MNRAAELVASHHVAERKENAAEQDDSEEKSHQVPALENPIAASTPRFPLPAISSYFFVAAACTHCEIISTGSGNTIVVFFSTPISVSVCKYRS